MKVPTFAEAIVSKNIYDYELSRNVLGWQLSYSGENIATFLNKDEAAQILKRMDEDDAAHDEQILLERERDLFTTEDYVQVDSLDFLRT